MKLTNLLIIFVPLCLPDLAWTQSGMFTGLGGGYPSKLNWTLGFHVREIINAEVDYELGFGDDYTVYGSIFSKYKAFRFGVGIIRGEKNEDWKENINPAITLKYNMIDDWVKFQISSYFAYEWQKVGIQDLYNIRCSIIFIDT